MRKSIFSILLLAGVLFIQVSCGEAMGTYSSDKPAYVIYNDNGRAISFNEMMNGLARTDICLFGELHNDPISHWLKQVIVARLHDTKGDRLVIGAEMWERDNQLLLDELLKLELIDLDGYEQGSVLWQNYATDYRPILLFAREHEIPFVATNIPRRYARIVSQRGEEALDSLSNQAKSYMAPLPIHFNVQGKEYEHIADMFKHIRQAPMSGSSLTNLVKAQAIKDATMAHFILENMDDGQYFFHFHGEFHSAFHSGIAYYLDHYRPGVRYKTISVIKQDDIMDFNSRDSRADYNIVVPNNMGVTYAQ